MDTGANLTIGTSDDIMVQMSEATSYINQEIPDDIIQKIIDELKADNELNDLILNTFPDDDDVWMFE